MSGRACGGAGIGARSLVRCIAMLGLVALLAACSEQPTRPDLGRLYRVGPTRATVLSQGYISATGRTSTEPNLAEGTMAAAFRAWSRLSARVTSRSCRQLVLQHDVEPTTMHLPRR